MIPPTVRSALALAIREGREQCSLGLLLADYTREAPVLLDPASGGELRTGDLPAFVLSTDGEAEDGNIVEQEWDLSRADAGIAPILVNHRVSETAPYGVGLWRSPEVRSLDGGTRRLIARADFDLGDPVAAAAAGKVARGYLRSVSVGWRPGGRMLRGDLPKDHPRYRAPMTDECGTRTEGYVMGTPGDPNRLIEASLTPIPADPGAVSWDGRSALALRQLDQLSRGEPVADLDLTAILLRLRSHPGVRRMVREVVMEELLAERRAAAAPAEESIFNLISRNGA